MSNQIKDVLEAHARTVHNDNGGIRMDEVNSRVRRVQARRRTAAAGGALTVAAMVGVGALTLTHVNGDPLPAKAPDELVGHRVPRTVQVLGATYRYARGVEGERGRAVLRLPEGRWVVRMASSARQGELRLWDTRDGDGRPVWAWPAGGFGAAYESAGPGGSTLRVAGPGRVALAAYRLSTPAPGVTEDGFYFPQRYAGSELLGVVTAARARQLSVGGGSRIALASQCAPLGRDRLLGVSVDGQQVTAGGCSSTRFAGMSFSDIPAPRDTIRVGLAVVDGRLRPVTPRQAARAAVGVYTSPRPERSGLAQIVQQDGHVWRLARTVRARQGERVASVRLDARRPLVVMAGGNDVKGGVLRYTVDGRTEMQSSAGGFGTATLATGRPATVQVRLTGGRVVGSLVFGVYRMAD